MGETRARLKVYGSDGKAIELEALVDSGATFTKVPKEMADSLGLKAQLIQDIEPSPKLTEETSGATPRIVLEAAPLGEMEELGPSPGLPGEGE